MNKGALIACMAFVITVTLNGTVFAGRMNTEHSEDGNYYFSNYQGDNSFAIKGNNAFVANWDSEDHKGNSNRSRRGDDGDEEDNSNSWGGTGYKGGNCNTGDTNGSSVPEPSTILLLGSGIVALFLRRRKNNGRSMG